MIFEENNFSGRAYEHGFQWQQQFPRLSFLYQALARYWPFAAAANLYL
jgi:hypothetical protein